MPGSQSEPGSGGESDNVPSKPSKRLKNRSKVWDRVPWFKKRNHSSDSTGPTACSSKAPNNYVSGQVVQGTSNIFPFHVCQQVIRIFPKDTRTIKLKVSILHLVIMKVI